METVSFMRRLSAMLGLAALQVLIFDRIALFGYVTPLFYIWLIVRFDSSMSRNAMLLWAFFTGFIIDTFSGTPGLNAASATLLALLHPYILKLFVTLDRTEQLLPGFASMGADRFIGYIFVMTLLHHTAYFTLRSIPLADWHVLLVKILLSTLLTILIMIVIERSSVAGYKR